jgi:uncharacterized protein YceK
MKYLVLLLLSGCATLQSLDVAQSKLAVATHADLLAAAKYATDHGYTARAAVWMAEDAKLSAIEAQINACASAIEAAVPKVSLTTPPTPFLGIEVAAEAVGTFSGVPSSVKINCEPFPIITLPVFPKLP